MNYVISQIKMLHNAGIMPVLMLFVVICTCLIESGCNYERRNKMIKHIKSTGVRVTNHDRAYDFYVNKLGLEVRRDEVMDGGYFWLEVAPSDAVTTLAVGPPTSEDSSVPLGGFAHIVFDTEDIQATYEELSGRGVRFTEEPTKKPWGGVQAQFVDPDGNIFVLVE